MRSAYAWFYCFIVYHIWYKEILNLCARMQYSEGLEIDSPFIIQIDTESLSELRLSLTVRLSFVFNLKAVIFKILG